MSDEAVEAYLEIGTRRVFAGVGDWPGWCRSGRDEAAALRTLLAYGPRYRAILAGTGLELMPPTAVDALVVVDRVPGGSGTDFGAPAAFAPGDTRPLDAAELARQVILVRACWAALDRAVAAADGHDLATGPRGGGRSVGAIVAHVHDAEGSYLARVGDRADLTGRPDRRPAVIDALELAAPIGQPAPGPRGGRRWPARYFARRVAWHALDHAWEIEDRTPA